MDTRQSRSKPLYPGSTHHERSLGQLEALPPSCLQLKNQVSQDRNPGISESLLSSGPHDGAQPSGGRVGKVISSNSLSNDPFKNSCSCK